VTVLDITPAPWMASASCAQADPDLWYPDRHDAVEVADAVRICHACPVRQECLDHAIAAGEDHGVWGGLTPGQRWEHAHGKPANRASRPPSMKPIDHGTASGFHQHYRRGSDACQPCLDAYAEYSARRRRAQKNKPATATPERVAAIHHGTVRGYRQHQRMNHPPCQPCRDARNADKRARRNQKKAA
jgi:hypothetical protein